MKFAKYHALGNDYLVVDPRREPAPLTEAVIRTLCHRHFGVGSDGVLLGPLPSARAPFALRIFNPDGSEAEKSGNGLRIFCRYLWDCGLVRDEEFTVETLSGLVRAAVRDGGRQVRIDMGSVRFWSDEIPVIGPRREVLNERLEAGDRVFVFCAATIGNPHCVLPLPEISASLAQRYGPLIETHALFPRRTNVQFLQVLTRDRIRLEIWERGAGYTLASGSSSAAAAAVAHRLGWCDADITVEMPGGELAIHVDPELAIRMTGPVTRVADGDVHPDVWRG